MDASAIQGGLQPDPRTETGTGKIPKIVHQGWLKKKGNIMIPNTNNFHMKHIMEVQPYLYRIQLL